jgi:hypothetical protein
MNMNQYVMWHEGKWAVKGENAQDFTSHHDSKKEAIETAKEIAMANDAQLVILKKDGTIDNLGVKGVDPFPDKDLAPDYNPDEESDEDY